MNPRRWMAAISENTHMCILAISQLTCIQFGLQITRAQNHTYDRIQDGGNCHYGFGFWHICVSNEDICIKFGTQIDVSMRITGWPKIKVKMVVTQTKFGMPLPNDMLINNQRSNLISEIEVQYGSYEIDSTFHRTYFQLPINSLINSLNTFRTAQTLTLNVHNSAQHKSNYLTASCKNKL